MSYIIVDKVSCLGGHLELFVIPVDDTHSISLTVSQVAWQVRPDPGPEQGRNPPGGWKMILVDVIQDPVIQRDKVLNLRL